VRPDNWRFGLAMPPSRVTCEVQPYPSERVRLLMVMVFVYIVIFLVRRGVRRCVDEVTLSASRALSSTVRKIVLKKFACRFRLTRSVAAGYRSVMQHITITEYLERDGRGAVERLARAAGVARATIDNSRQGRPVLLEKAVAISEATGGVVSHWSLLGMSAEAVAAVERVEPTKVRRARRPVRRPVRRVGGAT
jgi:hypothetical protein